jgi:hypothetical protein
LLDFLAPRFAVVVRLRRFEERFGLSGIGTQARRASESPIAIACLVFFTPCFPSRT